MHAAQDRRGAESGPGGDHSLDELHSPGPGASLCGYQTQPMHHPAGASTNRCQFQAVTIQDWGHQLFRQSFRAWGKDLHGIKTRHASLSAAVFQATMENKRTLGGFGHQANGHGWAHADLPVGCERQG